MQVKIEKKFQVQEPIEKVWGLLSDPPKVVSSVPGAKIIERVDDRTYKGSISVKVGPTATDYKGEVHILNMDPVGHRMEIEGKGQDVRGKGGATMKMTGDLKATSDGGTEVITTSEVSIVGLLAQFGGRMINDVSNRIFDEFTKSFRAQLAEMTHAETAIEGQPDSAGGAPVTAASADGTGSPASERVNTGPAPTPREPEPIKALPLVLLALRDAFVRFIRRLFGR
jgi:carbon monoxide dehydrogenase subunit G